jgi:hypothetical protein
MERRDFLKAGTASAAAFTIGSYSPQARAVLPVLRVIWSVGIRRYIVVPLLEWAAPSLFKTEMRKYLTTVALTLALKEVDAAIFSERAENLGADDLVRDGFERFTDIIVTNNTDDPIALTRLDLLLVDVNTKAIELKAKKSFSIVVNPESKLQLQFPCNRFPSSGLKQWYITDYKKILAVSNRFYCVS